MGLLNRPDPRTESPCTASWFASGSEPGGTATMRTATLTETTPRMRWNDMNMLHEDEIQPMPAEGFVVLQVEQGGLLSAAKLRLTRPNVRIVLLGCRSPEQIRDAEFIGAIPMPDASGLLDPAFTLKA